MFVQCVNHSEPLNELSSCAKFWKTSKVLSTNAMRPRTNATVDTMSMNRHGGECSTPSLRFLGGGEGDTIGKFFKIIHLNEMLTGECRATCHKGQCRLLER